VAFIAICESRALLSAESASREVIEAVRAILASVVGQADCNLFSLARARVTSSRMSLAFAVQMNGIDTVFVVKGSRRWD